jgi:hypothetical protein
MGEILVALKAAVEREKTVGDSMLVLMQGLAAAIEANKTDPAELQKRSEPGRGKMGLAVSALGAVQSS